MNLQSIQQLPVPANDRPEVVSNFTAELSLIKREKKLLIHLSAQTSAR